MNKIKNRNFPHERDLYGLKDTEVINCTFKGIEDGESALKECDNIALDSCYMDLRYPLWHDRGLTIRNTQMTPNCRAAIWYSSNIAIENSKLHGIKALRECQNTIISNSDIDSPEFGWKCSDIKINSSSLHSEYLFFESKNIVLDNVKFNGKYSFQYVNNLVISNSELDTKDAFWHAKDVVVSDSIVKGEYLAWFSENLTFINCTIIGTQPLCFCKNLKLINCKMVDTDLCFEYSEVEANIVSSITSVKNPYKGIIEADSIGEIILTEDSKYPCLAKIIQRNKKSQ